MKLKEWILLNNNIFIDSDLRFLIKNIFSNNYFSLIEDVFIDKEKLNYLEKVKRLYKEGMPISYILGKEEFFGLEFEINQNVLIPRKETELIVERAIQIIRENSLKKVLDLGTGCGNIAITIKKILKEEVVVFASDISFLALEVAKKNIDFHQVSIKLMNTDLFEGFKRNVFDLIVSNPPYVDPKEIKGSLIYEPRIALEAQEEGISFIKEILHKAAMYLKREGYLILEIGYNHREIVEYLVRKLGCYEMVDWIKDYSEVWRGIILKKYK
jgi:release factor glutamine methyltransferase